MTKTEIIVAGPAHAEIVAALHRATMGTDDPNVEGWSAAWVAKLLALPGAFACLALAPGDPPEPAGFALCLPAGEAFDLAAIGVTAGRRRAGIARLLLAHCEKCARAAGARRLMLEVAEDNGAARAFYAGSGFREVFRRRGYYRAQPGEAARDAIVLSKEL
jgi:[ribosomal protein S18]-alanine N-acetyltransferase